MAAEARSSRTSLVALVAVVVCALSGVAAWAPFALRSPLPLRSSERPAIPRELGIIPPWTADALEHPAGAASVLVEANDFGADRYLAVGAYANRIRCVPGVTDRGVDAYYSARLSPDGRQVAVGGEPTDEQSGVVLVDLVTGDASSVDTGGGYVEILAWSPDSTLVAYTADYTELDILDTRTGEARRIDVDAPALTDEGGPYPDNAGFVAFSPDGTSLAVDVGNAIRVMPLSGQGDNVEVKKQFDQALAGPAAWSPDGRLITVYEEEPVDEEYEEINARLSFLPIGGNGGSTPDTIAFRDSYFFDLLGWVSPTEPVTAEIGWEKARVVVNRLGSPDRRTLMKLDESVYRVEFATALLPDAGTRGSSHDTGPTPTWVFAALSTTSAFAVYAAGGLLLTVGVLTLSARRRRAAVATPAPVLPFAPYAPPEPRDLLRQAAPPPHTTLNPAPSAEVTPPAEPTAPPNGNTHSLWKPPL